MNCPACGSRSEVLRTLSTASTVNRERRCYACKARWWSMERLRPGTLKTIDSGYRPDTGVLPVAEKHDTGSNGFPSHSPSGSGSLPLSADPDPERARKSTSRAKREESADFCAWYGAYPKHVARGDAWKAWGQVEAIRPPLVDLLAAISWQRLQPKWQEKGGEFIPHPATYLRAHRWLDERPGANGNGHASKPTGPQPCKHHSNYRNREIPAPYPKPETCEDCRYVAARNRKREGEPRSVGEVMEGSR